MSQQGFYVVVFDSTHHAISAEKQLKKEKIAFNVIPTPREITASCGLSIKFNAEVLGTVQKVVEQENIAVKGVYIIEKLHDRKRVTQVS
ncbi:conserved hypothetical protein [Alkaliphilus metalliredigens QYMF]|uniref:Putative Se/S carrier protein-like domain-containing protein n=1 Tax=Alkaliphilus metalliredigens (strain QYMF) TaxID=293826 RepID=A6TJA3_ALKMQ|nr:DUF3343 domain-containing protein [Alkaliphilus metalliredigens]ABR46271.1 conserved hypothetical protein [Alkaliphilus metalliredigens QYMF]